VHIKRRIFAVSFDIINKCIREKNKINKTRT
jgi:hypothetical protein